MSIPIDAEAPDVDISIMDNTFLLLFDPSCYL